MTRKEEMPSPIEEPRTEDEASRVVARPDGYYWIADDGRQEFGPFASAALALAALREGTEATLEPGAELAEIESELGIADWIDPDTGERAEEESTRIEDH